MDKEIYGLFAYDSVDEFLTTPQKWHSASYAKRIEDLPVGGFAVQDGSFEVTLKLTVPAESTEARVARKEKSGMGVTLPVALHKSKDEE